MTDQMRWDGVDSYIVDQLHVSDGILDATIEASRTGDLPDIAVAPNQGRFLMLLAKAMGAERILEIGTLGGYSTIWLARALPDDGRLVSLEVDPHHASVALSNIAVAGFTDLVEVCVGPALKTLDAMIASGEEPFDLVFIDADKESYPEYFVRSLQLSRPGTVMIADNVVRDGEVVDASSSDERVQAVRRFLEIVGAEPRVTATAIQTVGTKGHDGFAMITVD